MRLKSLPLRAPGAASSQATKKRLVANMWTSSASRQWPFAPLNSLASSNAQKPRLKGIVFDVDGTLCLPQNYMFVEMSGIETIAHLVREALDIPKSRDILEHIESLAPQAQAEAQEKIRAIERRAMSSQTAQPGLVTLMEYLDSRQIPKGICTRNFEEPVNHLLREFLPDSHFDPVITRSFKPPKPDPAGILHIAGAWGEPSSVGARNMIMVGDSVDDMVAGYKAGAVTILLVQDEANRHVVDHEATQFCVHSLRDIVDVLASGKLEKN